MDSITKVFNITDPESFDGIVAHQLPHILRIVNKGDVDAEAYLELIMSAEMSHRPILEKHMFALWAFAGWMKQMDDSAPFFPHVTKNGLRLSTVLKVFDGRFCRTMAFKIATTFNNRPICDHQARKMIM